MLPAHRACRAATHNRNITHRKASMKRAKPGMQPGAGKKVPSSQQKTAAMNRLFEYSRK
jgi:hypothetical protein